VTWEDSLKKSRSIAMKRFVDENYLEENYEDETHRKE
jgi:hypothetical protein